MELSTYWTNLYIKSMFQAGQSACPECPKQIECPRLDINLIILLTCISVLIVASLAFGLFVYKTRLDYKIRRQINQFKRIDAQLGLDRIYQVNYGKF